ncbi:50S ribosomal protein L21 [Hansschlegelia sp.]|uniref:50S ribosomal protein L21 n=1 Tax=Hansschlegelia sp. TaxID=2041892 RepID=UPI002CF322A2|nr:50S ribosomal protein L21 [Hansschlegelia sp.]HVI30186.1 50S ribosomal protein L21 [Hansschlegelia sp.]
MFAVIKTGGKQHRVVADEVLTVGKLDGDVGSKITFGEILAIGSGDDVMIGAPLVSGASVAAEIVEHARGPKVIAFKKRRRQNSKRKRGHRQDYTIVKIVSLDGAKN